jgi:hypothetical protein
MPTCSFFDRRCPPRKRFGQIEFHSSEPEDDRKNPAHAGFSLLALTMHSHRGGVFAIGNKYEKIVVGEPIMSFKKLGLKALIVKC